MHAPSVSQVPMIDLWNDEHMSALAALCGERLAASGLAVSPREVRAAFVAWKAGRGARPGVEVQHRLYAALVARGVPVACELRLPARSRRSRSGWFYADLAVLGSDGLPRALCECKPDSRGRLAPGTRQRENYAATCLPYIVAGTDNFERALAFLAGHGNR